MKTRERLIEASGGCILGAVLGDQTETNAAMRVLSAIQPWLGLPLQRSCTNPAFEGLQDDPFVATALQIGHWVGRTQ